MILTSQVAAFRATITHMQTAIPLTGACRENSAPNAATSTCRSTAPADQAASASIARYSRNNLFAGVAKTDIREL